MRFPNVFKPSYLLLWILSYKTLVQASDGSCTLDCPVDQPCTVGPANFDGDRPANAPEIFSFHEKTDENNMHCDCLPGFTGLYCDRVFESCNGVDHMCYYGGSCIPGLQDEYGNNQLFCDCTNAQADDGTRYVGKYCEHEAVVSCGDADNMFCVNGATCNPNYPEGPLCFCPPNEFEGLHCEFRIGTIPTCDLDCQNGGQCVVGIEDPSQVEGSVHFNFGDDGEEYMRCVCPPGTTGPFCEVEVSEDTCGEHHCYHGGTCLELTIGGETKHHCDCSTAEDQDHSYAGRYCQFESTGFCDREDGVNGQLFCVNGGICPDDPEDGCQCPTGFTGHKCEFVEDASAYNHTHNTPPVATVTQNGMQAPLVDDPQYATCTLTCQNGGQCAKGVKDLGVIEQVGADVEHLSETYDDNFEHCVCPDGFVGLTCNHRVSICGEGEHVCLHGSTCVQNGQEYECDCTTTNSDVADGFAGDSCEHPATDICNEERPGPGQPLYFCVNQGTCNAVVPITEPHPGCTCLEGFTGDHCELRVGEESAAGDQLGAAEPATNSDAGPEAFEIIVLLVALVAIVVSSLVAVSVYVRSRRQQRDHDLLAREAELRRNLTFDREFKNRRALSIGVPGDNIAACRYTDNPEESAVLSNSSGSSTEEARSLRGNVAPAEGPQVYIGPPCDEDGNELHNVDII